MEWVIKLCAAISIAYNWISKTILCSAQSDMPQLSKYAKFFAELEHGAISKDRSRAVFDL